MRGICLPAHVTNDSPAATASFPNFVHSDAKTVARRHPTAHHWSAIRAHDHTVIRPARGGKIERARAHVRFQLGGATHMRKAERLGVDGPPSNKNGQATPGPAMLVQRGIYVDHQALPQTAFPPVWRARRGAARPGFRKSLTRCCALVRRSIQDVGSLSGRQFSPHCVVAAIDMHELARGHVQELR